MASTSCCRPSLAAPRAASPHSRGADGHTTPHQKTRAVTLKVLFLGAPWKHHARHWRCRVSRRVSFPFGMPAWYLKPLHGQALGCLVRCYKKGLQTQLGEPHRWEGNRCNVGEICWDTATLQASNAAGVRPGLRAHLQNTCHLGLRSGSSCKLRVQLLQHRAKTFR